jgi:hypothetical protein
MKLTHIMSKFFLTHIVSEAAKTFGKSHILFISQVSFLPFWLFFLMVPLFLWTEKRLGQLSSYFLEKLSK